VLTVGVEEEFFLLEPGGAVAPVAGETVRLAGDGQGVVPEYMPYQLETTTRVCTGLDELRSELMRLRLLAASAAARYGARLVATGAAPFATGPLGALTENRRYRELARRFPAATESGRSCACQVHVGISDRNLAVDVLTRLRPWLPVLLALTVNSPVRNGVDTGWSSSRYRAQLSWPTFRPPDVWRDASRYDQAVRGTIRRGAAMDEASVYFLARLSARFPTVEVRLADTCLTAEDTLLYAGVVRALVTALIDDARRGARITRVSASRLNGSLLAVARRGMPNPTTHMLSSGSPASGPLALLQAKIAPVLAATGDADDIRAGLERLARLGTGADRQRALWTTAAEPAAFVTAVADATVPAGAMV
jgi:carboxylate-amine ligase